MTVRYLTPRLEALDRLRDVTATRLADLSPMLAELAGRLDTPGDAALLRRAAQDCVESAREIDQAVDP